MTSLLTYPLVAISKRLPPDMLADMVVDSIAKRPDATAVGEATVVRLANKLEDQVLEHGREFVDGLKGADKKNRLRYQLRPFSGISGGALDVVIAQDENKELYVLMGKKDGTDQWSLPAGYMKTRQSFSKQGLYTSDTEARDKFEEAMMRGARDSKEPLQSLSNNEPNYDRSLADTARRELREETTLNVDADKFSFVGNRTNNGEAKSKEGPQPYQGIDNTYLVDLRSQGSLPPVAETDDLGSPIWVKLKDIEPTLENGQRVLRAHGSAIEPTNAEAIEDAVGKMRTREYEARGLSEQGVRSAVPAAKPDSELGGAAIAWHNEALQAASRLQKLMGAQARTPGEMTR